MLLIIMGILSLLAGVYGGVAAVSAVGVSHLAASRKGTTVIQMWKKDPWAFAGFGAAWPITVPLFVMIAPFAIVVGDAAKAAVPVVMNSRDRAYRARVDAVKQEYQK